MALTASRAHKARDRRMPLLAHLVELRRRLLLAAGAVLLAAVAGWLLAPFVLDALRAPLSAFAEQHGRLASLNYDTIAGAFDLRLRIALYLGILLSSPIWLYQIWAFLTPALTKRELRYVVGFLGSALPLFLGGCAAGWYVVPHMVQLLAGFASGGSTTLVRAGDYVDFVLRLMLAVGVGFVLPVFLVLLDFAGVVTARTILRGWRIAVLAITVFTALVTPAADLVSMGLLALPLVALYFAAAGVAALHDRHAARVAQRFLDAPAPVAGIR